MQAVSVTFAPLAAACAAPRAAAPRAVPAAARPALRTAQLRSCAPLRAAPLAARAVARRAPLAVSATAAPLSNADPSKWITGITPNNNIVRLAAAAVALVAANNGTTFMTLKACSFLHTLTWAAWFGSMFYTTFVAGIVMFKSLPRQTFRDVQEVLFPAFFQLGALAIALQMAFVPLLHPGAAAGAPLTLLGLSLVATLANLLWVEPATTVVMKERAELERMTHAVATGFYPEGKDAAMKRLSASFGKLHGASSVFNLAALCGAITYAWRYILA